MFPDKISARINRKSKVHCPPGCGQGSPNLLGACLEKKAEEGRICAAPDCGTGMAASLLLRLPAWPGHLRRPLSGSWALRLHHEASWVSSLQRADCGTSQPPYSRVPTLDNTFLDLDVSGYIPLPLVLFLWRTVNTPSHLADADSARPWLSVTCPVPSLFPRSAPLWAQGSHITICVSRSGSVSSHLGPLGMWKWVPVRVSSFGRCHARGEW